jgi:TonB family protein
LPIDTPVPDVSGTLAIPSTAANPADLAQVEASRLAVPALLTAQITATPLPAEQPETMPDTIARPKDESQTFSADPTTSLCRITPEAARYLGSTVAVQVVTNETGQVTEAIVRQSSQNSAYDELATCMVKQWQFEPATKQGQPVQSDALIVAIRIS